MNDLPSLVIWLNVSILILIYDLYINLSKYYFIHLQ